MTSHLPPSEWIVLDPSLSGAGVLPAEDARNYSFLLKLPFSLKKFPKPCRSIRFYLLFRDSSVEEDHQIIIIVTDKDLETRVCSRKLSSIGVDEQTNRKHLDPP